MTVATATHEIWVRLVERTLKGASLDKLVSRSADDLPIEPLYRASSPADPAPLRAAGRWRLAQRVDHAEPEAACASALADLEGGAEELVLVFSGSRTGRGFGLRAATVEALERALEGVRLELIGLRLETAPFDGRPVVTRLLELVVRRGLEAKALSIDFGLDPVSDMARSGGLPFTWPELAGRFAGTAKLAADRGFVSSLARIDGRAAHEAGASEAQELAFALATGLTYLRVLEGEGFSLDQARKALSFLLVADADEFLTIAKFRAMRRLWAQVERACGLAVEPITLAAETAWRMTTRRDPYANVLRATLAAFSGGIGGADSICVLPFTSALGLADPFARRVARNLQQVLLEESQLWRVADAAAGAGAFEALTEALAHKAWALFQEIEREGGIVESLSRGKLQARIAAVRAGREKEIGRRKAPITGVSEFALLSEQPVAVLAPAPDEAKVARSGLALTQPCEALPSIRFAEPFEHLRDRSDAYLARTGRRPSVFLANLGGAASFTPRRLFAKSLFEGGGIEAIENDKPATLTGIVDAFHASGARLACLCSSDEVYAQQAGEALRALKGAGAVKLAVAGRPGDLTERLVGVPVDLFVYAGCEALEVLTGLHDDLFAKEG
ncbi:methylmalonyl-CoA mutase [Rhizobiales bacterium GAS191]|nr:methylmalonyl-CoA mutase [Rhizobiales bacterium GAS191]